MVREGSLPPGAAGHERGAPAGLAGGSAKVVVDDDRRMVGQPHPTVLPIDLGSHGGARETPGRQVAAHAPARVPPERLCQPRPPRGPATSVPADAAAARWAE